MTKRIIHKFLLFPGQYNWVPEGNIVAWGFQAERDQYNPYIWINLPEDYEKYHGQKMLIEVIGTDQEFEEIKPDYLIGSAIGPYYVWHLIRRYSARG